MEKKDSLFYLKILSNIVISLALFLLPIFFLSNATDFFILPKQLLVIGAVILLLVLWGTKILFERKIILTINPLNLPIAIFTIVILASAILSRNRYDALIQTAPVVFAILLFFAIVNNVRDRKSFSVVLLSFVLGGAASALVTIAYFLNLYFLPIPEIKNQFFNTFGSIVQQLIYLIPILIFSGLYILKAIGFPKVRLSQETKTDPGFFIQLVAFLSVLAGVLLIAYQIIFLPNKPVILPYIYGFQTAFAAISQDAPRFILSLLFGSGYGTFLIDFTRFKLAAFNLEQNIWNLNFAFSSSYLLELVATTGLLGALSFLSIIFAILKSRASSNPLFFAVLTILALSLILPFSYISVVLLFALLGIYCAYLNIEGDSRVYDIVLSLVATKSGMLSFEATPEGEHARPRSESPILPGVVFLLILIFVGTLGFYTYKFVISDLKFAESIRQAAANNGQKTYQLQTEAIRDFSFRSDYHRIFSQVNLALANSIAGGIQPGTPPNQQMQQNIIALLQQSINSARNAVILSPQISVNWQNLAQVYRSLINVGQNAESFAIASMNQAIALDPYNPQLYIQLGGIYYQLKQWDQAQSQFQVAINLKRDFANAYYNLGHTLEEKGDLQNALGAYQIVRQLSRDNKDNLSKIAGEIKALEAKIGEAAKAQKEVEPETEQTPLSISEPSANLPPQKPPIKISPPPTGKEATQSAQ